MELGSQGHETNGINNKEAGKVFNSESKGISAPHPSQISSGESIAVSISLTEIQGKNETSNNPASFNLNASAGPTANFSFPPLTRDLNSVPSEAEFLVDTGDATNNLQDQFLAFNEQGATFDDMVIVADGMVTSAPAPFSGDKLGTTVQSAEQYRVSTDVIQDSALVLSLNISEASSEAKYVSKSECLQGEVDATLDAGVIIQATGLSEALPMTVDEKTEAAQENIVSKADVESNDVTEKDIQSIKGQKVKKKFGKKSYSGVVVDYDPETKWFKVVYEDEDQEELELWEVKAILASSDSTPMAKKRSRTEVSTNEEHQKSSKKPKKFGTEISLKSPSPGKSGKSKGQIATSKHKTPQKGKFKSTNSLSSKKNSRSPSTAKQQKSTTKRKPGGDSSTEPKAKRLKGVTKSGISIETDISGDAFVGRHVKKDFGGQLYGGVVVKFDKKTQYYKVKYEDGDQEDLELDELQPILIQETLEPQPALVQENHDPQPASVMQENHDPQPAAVMQENHELQPVPMQENHDIQPVWEREKFEMQPVLEQEKREIQPVMEQEKREIQPVVELKKHEIQSVLEQEKCKIQSVLEEVRNENQPVLEQDRNELQPIFVQEKNESQPNLSQDKDNPDSVTVQEKHMLEPELVQEKPSMEAVEEQQAETN